MNVKSTLAALCVAATSIGHPVHAHESETQLLIWNNYISPNIVRQYGAETGSALLMDTFSVSDQAEGRLAVGGTGYDLAVVPLSTIPRLQAVGALQPLLHTSLPFPNHVDPAMREKLQSQMPEAEDYTVPFLWGTTGLVLDVAAIEARLPNVPTDSWALLFDPKNAAKLADCGISLVDSPQEVVSNTLAYLGRDPNSMESDDLDAAFDTLAAILPYVKTVTAEQFDQLEAGDVCLAMVWSPDGLAPQVRHGSEAYCYIVPQEGAVLWADVFVVPADAPSLANTRRLLDYLLSPDVGREVADFAMATISFSEASHGTMNATQRDTLDLALPAASRDQLFMLQSRSGAQKRIIDQRWRRLLVGR